MADLVDRLTEYDVKIFGFDAVFSSPDESSGIANIRKLKDQLIKAGLNGPAPLGELDKAIGEADYDETLRNSLKNSKRAVLGYFFHFSKEGLEHLEEEEMSKFLENISRSKYDGIKSIHSE